MATRHSVTVAMAGACARFLDALDDQQRSSALWPFPSDAERRLWFYTPTDHGGLSLSDIDAPQQRLAFQLLSTGLSTAGYVTASTIIGLENVLDMIEGFSASWSRPRGRDPLLYYVRVFGVPESAGTWAWRIGGHHVSVNLTIVDGRVAGSTPLFLGADPASAPLLGPHPLRPLAGVEDLARELARSLDPDQRARAVVADRAPTDLVGGNRTSLRDGDVTPPLRDIWRGRLSHADDELATRIQAAPTRPPRSPTTTSRRCRSPSSPKGSPPPRCDRFNVRCSTHFSASTRNVSPTMSPTSRTTSSPAPGSTPFTSCGPVALNRVNRTTTGCTAHCCSPNTTTPRAGRTTCTPCGEILAAISPTTYWPATARPTVTTRSSVEVAVPTDAAVDTLRDCGVHVDAGRGAEATIECVGTDRVLPPAPSRFVAAERGRPHEASSPLRRGWRRARANVATQRH
jgi:hypothetical protein